MVNKARMTEMKKEAVPKTRPHKRPQKATTHMHSREAGSTLDNFIERAAETTGWQRQHHERAAVVTAATDGAFLCSVVQFVQPGLQSFLPWLADTMGAGWARWAVKALEFMFVTNTPTTSAGNIVLGWLPNASDPLPTNMLEATQNAVYASGNINANRNLRIRKGDLEEAFDELKFTRRGFVEGDINNYDAGVFYVATDGFNTLETGTIPDMLDVGFIDVKMDVAFVDKKVATEPLLASKFNTELTVLYSQPASPVAILPWLDGNNNPVGIMVDADGSPQFEHLYIPYGTFEITIHARAQNTVASVLEWRAEVAQDSDFDTPASFVPVLGSEVSGAYNPSLPIIVTTSTTFVITNPSREVLALNPASEFQQYRTLCRLRLIAGGNTLFSGALAQEEFHTLIIRRLPTIGPVGLDSGSASPHDLIGRSLRNLAFAGHPAPDIKKIKCGPDACQLARLERAKVCNDTAAYARRCAAMLDNNGIRR